MPKVGGAVRGLEGRPLEGGRQPPTTSWLPHRHTPGGSVPQPPAPPGVASSARRPPATGESKQHPKCPGTKPSFLLREINTKVILRL
ncbi:basic salivary proline-rich protein 1-like [Sapajus apella]|uniref:Basic salivary proline-rich protein 1-like n=1 Tax=Sapajus apella TaxID=9515 RepID=A0A6J3IR63_SAPAP|nr:basic salivary proline-rich protein 1-like [Sapajus apella]